MAPSGRYSVSPKDTHTASLTPVSYLLGGCAWSKRCTVFSPLFSVCASYCKTHLLKHPTGCLVGVRNRPL